MANVATGKSILSPLAGLPPTHPRIQHRRRVIDWQSSASHRDL